MNDIASRLLNDGFVALPNQLASDALLEVEALLDPLFDRIHGPRGRESVDPEPPRGALEVDRAVRMAPVLRRTAAFKHCESLAKSLLGARAAYVYDHAIYKMPRAQNGTDWHQDEAYGSIAGRLGSLHFWIPLQTVTNETGCMRFIAASHRAGSLKHDRAARSHVRRVPEVDESVATWCPLAAGGITIHTPRTLHATSGNRAGHIRKAWILHFGPWGTLAKLHPLSVIRRCQRTLTELAW